MELKVERNNRPGRVQKGLSRWTRRSLNTLDLHQVKHLKRFHLGGDGGTGKLFIGRRGLGTAAGLDLKVHQGASLGLAKVVPLPASPTGYSWLFSAIFRGKYIPKKFPVSSFLVLANRSPQDSFLLISNPLIHLVKPQISLSPKSSPTDNLCAWLTFLCFSWYILLLLFWGPFMFFTEKKDLWRPEKVGKSLWPFLSSLFLPGLSGRRVGGRRWCLQLPCSPLALVGLGGSRWEGYEYTHGAPFRHKDMDISGEWENKEITPNTWKTKSSRV